MVHPPKEILDLLYYDDKTGEMAIKDDATDEQKRIFESFLLEVKTETLTDRTIEI